MNDIQLNSSNVSQYSGQTNFSIQPVYNNTNKKSEVEIAAGNIAKTLNKGLGYWPEKIINLLSGIFHITSKNSTNEEMRKNKSREKRYIEGYIDSQATKTGQESDVTVTTSVQEKSILNSQPTLATSQSNNVTESVSRNSFLVTKYVNLDKINVAAIDESYFITWSSSNSEVSYKNHLAIQKINSSTGKRMQVKIFTSNSTVKYDINPSLGKVGDKIGCSWTRRGNGTYSGHLQILQPKL